MLLNVPLQGDLKAIQQKQQLIIDKNLRQQNARWRHHDYSIGDVVYIKEHDPNKLQQRSHVPHPITKVHSNVTLTLQQTPHV